MKLDIKSITNFLLKVALKPELMVPFFIVAIVVFLVIPLPAWTLDILLAINISVSLMILLIVIYTEKPLDFSVFPGLLLLTTLFRLSLNVSSTRLILSKGYAGEVINTFGNFVTMGNIVVGVVIFLILVIIQFVVITKGAGRIAEVAARFTLDAMPGKQMAIDADLNAGLIDEQTARKRREEIRREADFYGAMDGASKFVRGDAIAGIIITIVNIIGGIVLGMIFQNNLSFMEILEKYTKLTIGDGLVSQLPSLMISTAAGIIVARASSVSDMGSEIISQLFTHSNALFIASVVLLGLGIVPGFPFLPFFIIAAVLGILGYVSIKGKFKQKEIEEGHEEEMQETEEDKIENYLIVDPLELEIGYALISLVDPSQGGDLLDRIAYIRKQIAMELGFKVPPIRIRDNFELKPNEYVIKIKGIEVGRAEVMPGYYLILDPGTATHKIDGIPTVEPTFGLDAMWITESMKPEAEEAGYTIVEVPAIITTHLSEIIKEYADELLNRDAVKELIDNLKKTHPTVVEEVVGKVVQLGDIQKVLANLLWERVSIRDLATILETIGDYAKQTKNYDVLTEYVRHALARQIVSQLLGSDKKLHVVMLNNKLERLLEEHLEADNNQNLRLNLDPNFIRTLADKIKEKIDLLIMEGYEPVLLVSPILRLQLKRVLYPYIKNLFVLSVTEIPSNVEVETIAEVNLEN